MGKSCRPLVALVLLLLAAPRQETDAGACRAARAHRAAIRRARAGDRGGLDARLKFCVASRPVDSLARRQ
jgi:hypothetical protein